MLLDNPVGYRLPYPQQAIRAGMSASYGSITQHELSTGTQGNWRLLSPPQFVFHNWLGPVHPAIIEFPGGRLIIEEVDWGMREPAWFTKAIVELRKLLSLPFDWDSYRSQTVDPMSAVRAIQLLAAISLDDTPAPQIVPAQNGGLQLEWHRRGIDLEIEIQDSGRITAMFEDKRESVEWEKDITVNWDPLLRVMPKLVRPPR